LFADWYGYTKTVKEAKTVFSTHDLGHTDPRTFVGIAYLYISPKVAEIIKNLPKEEKGLAIAARYPACDGYTDEDFKNWLDRDDRPFDYPRLPWREQVALERNSSIKQNYWLGQLLRSFFSYNSRSERIFRIIELNEFIHRAKENQTLKDFLETDTSYQDKCRSLEITVYTDDSKRLFSNEDTMPKFLKFGENSSLKIKEQLLKLTRVELEKVLDWENNPFLSKSASDASLPFVMQFIKAAFGEVKKAPITELSKRDMKNAVMSAFLSGSQSFWDSLGTRKDVSLSTETVIDELRRIDFNAAEMKRNFSYLIHTGILNKLSPVEVIAVTLGYEKPARWAEKNKLEPTLELATQMMIDEKLDPEFFARLVAYVIINNLDLISLDEEFLENDFKDIPMSWAYNIISKSKQKRTLVHPKAILALL
jgi:hypothetical protein